MMQPVGKFTCNVYNFGKHGQFLFSSDENENHLLSDTSMYGSNESTPGRAIHPSRVCLPGKVFHYLKVQLLFSQSHNPKRNTCLKRHLAAKPKEVVLCHGR